jgi:hypothetical protein
MGLSLNLHAVQHGLLHCDQTCAQRRVYAPHLAGSKNGGAGSRATESNLVIKATGQVAYTPGSCARDIIQHQPCHIGSGVRVVKDELGLRSLQEDQGCCSGCCHATSARWLSHLVMTRHIRCCLPGSCASTTSHMLPRLHTCWPRKHHSACRCCCVGAGRARLGPSRWHCCSGVCTQLL